MTSGVQDTRSPKIGNAPNDPQTELEHLLIISQKYSIYTKYLLLRPKFWSVSLYDLLFPRYNMYKVGENRKCTE